MLIICEVNTKIVVNTVNMLLNLYIMFTLFLFYEYKR
jgi:hypothetical protein